MSFLPSGTIISGTASKLTIPSAAWVLGISGFLNSKVLETGAAVSNQLDALSSNLSSIYYPNTNPAGYLPATSTGQLTGIFLKRNETGVFATDAKLLAVSGSLQGQLGGLGLDLTPYATTLYVNQQVSNLSTVYYPRNSNPSNYLVAADLGGYVLKTQTGVFASDLEVTTAINGLSTVYYPLSANPAGYLTSTSLNGYVTTAQTGVFASDIELTNAINALSAVYYPLSSNPSNFLTTAQTGVFASVANLQATGSFLDTKINTLSGSVGVGSAAAVMPASHVIINAVLTLTNQVAASTEIANGPRFSFDFTNTTQMRYCGYVSVVGTTNAKIGLQYSTNGTAWTDLGVLLPIGPGSTTLARFTAWEAMPVGAKTEVTVRAVTVGGDGVADPVVRGFMLQTK